MTEQTSKTDQPTVGLGRGVVPRVVRSKPFRLIPKRIDPILAGAHGWDGGAGISWLWWMLVAREPGNV